MRRTLTPGETALWRRVALNARPLRGKAVPPEPEGEAPAPKPNQNAGASSPAAPKAPPPRRGLAPPADRGGERRVQRGKLEIAARFDLHGLTQDGARSALLSFVRTERADGARLVLVITGKGGPEGGVLKRRLPDWIGAADFRAHVSGFAEAHRRHGGAGAVYLFLKRPD